MRAHIGGWQRRIVKIAGLNSRHTTTRGLVVEPATIGRNFQLVCVDDYGFSRRVGQSPALRDELCLRDGGRVAFQHAAPFPRHQIKNDQARLSRFRQVGMPFIESHIVDEAL